MKLKNKKTGEVGYLIVGRCGDHYVVDKYGYDRYGKYDSLAKLNEEWEDYEEPKDAPEEPKGNWYINEFGTPTKADFVGRETLYDKCRKNFGNYFETQEEAEKTVEKLKAWKRVKRDLVSLDWQRERDGGFSVWGEFKTGITLRPDVYLDNHSKDLDLIFGGKDGE